MKKFEVKGHEPSLLPDGNWKLVWCDEFDGKELDTSKWEYRTHIWGERHPCFAESGVELDGNSNAVFKIFEKDGEICSPHLLTYTRPLGNTFPAKFSTRQFSALSVSF